MILTACVGLHLSSKGNELFANKVIDTITKEFGAEFNPNLMANPFSHYSEIYK